MGVSVEYRVSACRTPSSLATLHRRRPPVREEFILESLGPEHNERDHTAWMSSVDHICNTPGFPMPDGWPTPMGLDENLVDLQLHAARGADPVSPTRCSHRRIGT